MGGENRNLAERAVGQAGLQFEDEQVEAMVDRFTALLNAKDRETASALAQAAAQEARAEGLEGLVEELERRADSYEKGEENDSPEAMIRWRGLAAGSRDAAGLIRQALSAPRPEPSRVLEVVREAIQVVDDWDATADALERGRDESASPEERSLALAVDNLTPEERAALGEDTL